MRTVLRDQPARPITKALILDDDARARSVLRQTLVSLGLEAQEMSDGEAALDIMRASPAPLALFFSVEAHGETLDGQGYISIIGALLKNPELARQHICAVISSTADEVEWALGKTLARLDVPVLGKLCAAGALESYLTRAQGWGPEIALTTAPTW
jgi:CheY-like chemotaxis protein